MGELERVINDVVLVSDESHDELRNAALAVRQISRNLTRRGRDAQLIVWETNAARCLVYAGEWIARCPLDCGNAEYMTDKHKNHRGVAGIRGDYKDVFVCSYCRHVTNVVEWPDERDEITEILDRRPWPHTRNWYPAGHLDAVNAGVADGETIAELLVDNARHGVS